MKKLLSLALFAVSSLALADVDSSNPVRTYVLNHWQVVQIPISTERLTTIAFPSPIAGLESVFISAELDPDARFQLSFERGGRLFSLRALVKSASANLNVIWRSNVYVLEFYESEHPALSVSFLEEGTPLPSQAAAPKPTLVTPLAKPVESTHRPEQAAAPRPQPQPSNSPNASKHSASTPPAQCAIQVVSNSKLRLPATIETAKNFASLCSNSPASAVLVQHETPNSWLDYGTHYLRLDEIFRFDKEDTLIFRATLRNKTGYALNYDPLWSGVRIGDQVFYANPVEADGRMLPYAESTIYLQINRASQVTGRSLASLSRFQVFVSQPCYDPPATTTVKKACPSSASHFSLLRVFSFHFP